MLLLLHLAAVTSLHHLGRPEVWPFIAIMAGGLLGYHYVVLPALEGRRADRGEVPMPRTLRGVLAGLLCYALTFSGVYFYFHNGGTPPARDGIRYSLKVDREVDVYRAGPERRYSLAQRRVEGSLAVRGQGAFSKLDESDTFVDEEVPSGAEEHCWIQLQGAPGESTLLVSDTVQVVRGRSFVEHYLAEVEYDRGSWEDFAAGRPVEFHLSAQGEAARLEAEERYLVSVLERNLPPEMAGMRRTASAVAPVRGTFRAENGEIRFTSKAAGSSTVLFER